jgi:hypothetical protein
MILVALTLIHLHQHKLGVRTCYADLELSIVLALRIAYSNLILLLFELIYLFSLISLKFETGNLVLLYGRSS